MKTIALCSFGLVLGIGAAFVTQTPVLETLGYQPEEEVSAVVADVDQTDEAAEGPTADPQSITSQEPPVPSTEKVLPVNGLAAKADPTKRDPSKWEKAFSSKDKEVANNVARAKPTSLSKKVENKHTTAAVKKAKPTPKPAAELVAKPAAKPSTKLAAKPATKPVANPKAKPVALLSSDPATKPAMASSKAPSIKQTEEVKANTTNRVVAAKPAIGSNAAKPATSNVAKTETKAVAAKPEVDSPKPTKSTAEPTPESKPIAAKEPVRLAGKWKVAKAIHAGRLMPAKLVDSMSLQFVDEDIVIQVGEKREVGKFEIGEAHKTKVNVFTELEIKSSQENGPSIKGFYFSEGETLFMVWGAPGADRPNPNVPAELEAARTLFLTPESAE